MEGAPAPRRVGGSSPGAAVPGWSRAGRMDLVWPLSVPPSSAASWDESFRPAATMSKGVKVHLGVELWPSPGRGRRRAACGVRVSRRAPASGCGRRSRTRPELVGSAMLAGGCSPTIRWPSAATRRRSRWRCGGASSSWMAALEASAVVWTSRVSRARPWASWPGCRRRRGGLRRLAAVLFTGGGVAGGAEPPRSRLHGQWLLDLVEELEPTAMSRDLVQWYGRSACRSCRGVKRHATDLRCSRAGRTVRGRRWRMS